MREAPDPAQALREALAAGGEHADLDFLMLAAVERAPADAEVAGEVARTLREFDAAIDLACRRAGTGGNTPSELAGALTAMILGLRLRARADGGATSTGGASAAAAIFEPGGLTRC